MEPLRLPGWRLLVFGVPPLAGLRKLNLLVLRVQFVPLKAAAWSFHGREVDFIALRVPMLGNTINPSALNVPIETRFGGHGGRCKIVPHDIDLAFQFVQHRSCS